MLYSSASTESPHYERLNRSTFSPSRLFLWSSSWIFVSPVFCCPTNTDVPDFAAFPSTDLLCWESHLTDSDRDLLRLFRKHTFFFFLGSMPTFCSQRPDGCWVLGGFSWLRWIKSHLPVCLIAPLPSACRAWLLVRPLNRVFFWKNRIWTPV